MFFVEIIYIKIIAHVFVRENMDNNNFSCCFEEMKKLTFHVVFEEKKNNDNYSCSFCEKI